MSCDGRAVMALLVLLAVSAFATSVGSSQLVNVSFYSEALCPFCDLFTEGGMNEAVQKVRDLEER